MIFVKIKSEVTPEETKIVRQDIEKQMKSGLVVYPEGLLEVFEINDSNGMCLCGTHKKGEHCNNAGKVMEEIKRRKRRVGADWS